MNNWAHHTWVTLSQENHKAILVNAILVIQLMTQRMLSGVTVTLKHSPRNILFSIFPSCQIYIPVDPASLTFGVTCPLQAWSHTMQSFDIYFDLKTATLCTEFSLFSNCLFLLLYVFLYMNQITLKPQSNCKVNRLKKNGHSLVYMLVTS